MNNVINFIEKYLFFSVFIPVMILFLLVRFVFQFDGLYGQDAYEYERYAGELLMNKPVSGTQSDFFWPVYYPLAGAILKLLFSSPGFALQLVSVLCFGLLIYISVRLNEKINGAGHRYSYVWFIVFLLFSPYVFRNGFSCMSDMLAAVLVLLAIYYSYKYWREPAAWFIVFAFSFGVMAFFTRYASAVVLLVPFAAVISKGRFLQISIASAIAFLFTLPWLWLKTDPVNSLSHPFLQNWSAAHFFQSGFSTEEGVASYRFPNIIYAFENIFHPGYFAPGAVLVLVLIAGLKKITYKKEHFIFLLIPVVIYAFFLAGISRQNDRFLLLTFPLVLIFLYPVWRFIIEKNRWRIPMIIIPVFLFVNMFISVIAFRTVYTRNQTERIMTEKLKELDMDLLYTFEMDTAIKLRGFDKKIINIWEEEIKEFNESADAYVLMDSSNISSQWKGKLPYLNYIRIIDGFQLEEITTLNRDQWKLFKMKRKNVR
ncbi:MAG: ArnT family glycosyltransferase [Bacteroidota bacterium]